MFKKPTPDVFYNLIWTYRSVKKFVCVNKLKEFYVKNLNYKMKVKINYSLSTQTRGNHKTTDEDIQRQNQPIGTKWNEKMEIKIKPKNNKIH
jgi:hypothetical protein